MKDPGSVVLLDGKPADERLGPARPWAATVEMPDPELPANEFSATALAVHAVDGPAFLPSAPTQNERWYRCVVSREGLGRISAFVRAQDVTRVVEVEALRSGSDGL